MSFKQYLYVSAIAISLIAMGNAVAGTTPSQAVSSVDTWVSEAMKKKLYEKKHWLALLHYRHGHSVITDHAFFLGMNGESSPQAELAASIRAFLGPNPSGQICRFPARYKWLCDELGVDQAEFAKSSCHELAAYLNATAMESASLSFASESFKQVGSLMGHLFLRIDGDNGERITTHALGFAATIDSLNPLSIYWDAIFSGLDGRYILKPYRQKVEEYNAAQRRNLVEFPLDLTPSQVETLALHIWEMRQIEVKYNFITNNCGTGVMALLYVADPNLEQAYHLFDTPKDIIGRLIDTGDIDNMHLRPSINYEIRQLSHDLTGSERGVVKKVIDERTLSGLEEITSEARRQRLLLLIHAGIDDISMSEERSDTSLEVLRTDIERQMDPEIKSDILAAQFEAYKKGFHVNNSSNLSLGFIHQGGPAWSMEFSPAYNNLSSDNSEYFREFRLRILRLNLNYYPEEEKIIVDTLELVNFKNIIPQNVLTGGVSGEFKLSLEQEEFGGKGNHLYPDLLIGRGVAQALFHESVICYVQLRLGDAYYNHENVAYVSPEAGLFFRYKWGKAHAYAHQLFATSSYKYRQEAGFSNTLFLQKNHDINFSLKKFKTDKGKTAPQYTLKYNFYF